MLLTVTTTHQPATDLGYLLMKHPDRVHELDLPSGRAVVFFPEATPQRCTAALVLEVDPLKLQAGRRQNLPDSFSLGLYVNDRPYAASSLLSTAMSKAFRTAMRGTSKERPELADAAIPLELRVPVLRCRGGADLAVRLFEPLGWTVSAQPIALDETYPEWGDSRYVDLTLTGTIRLADALQHLYVLIPVLDDARHFWVTADDIETLLRSGDGWLGEHPERRLIVHRYLAHQRHLAEPAMERLTEADDASVGDAVIATNPDDEDADLSAEKTVPLARQRREAVLAALVASGANRVLDLGCGPGALLADLVKHRQFTEIVGCDVSARALALAARKLRLDQARHTHNPDRVRLVQSALTYRDARLAGYDAAVLMEVIEHLDEDRLPSLEESVFGQAKPGTVIVTTPNVEYNARYESLPAGEVRHHDHRFEWTREQFRVWAGGVAADRGYTVAYSEVGDHDPELGSPTQMAVFTREVSA